MLEVVGELMFWIVMLGFMFVRVKGLCFGGIFVWLGSFRYVCV